jgi:hypothetical protein
MSPLDLLLAAIAFIATAQAINAGHAYAAATQRHAHLQKAYAVIVDTVLKQDIKIQWLESELGRSETEEQNA